MLQTIECERSEKLSSFFVVPENPKQRYPLILDYVGSIALETALWRMAKVFCKPGDEDKDFICTSQDLFGFIKDTYCDLPEYILMKLLFYLKNTHRSNDSAVKVFIDFDEKTDEIIEDKIIYPRDHSRVKISQETNPIVIEMLRKYESDVFADTPYASDNSLKKLIRDVELMWLEETGEKYSPDHENLPHSLTEEWEQGKARVKAEEKRLHRQDVEGWQEAYKAGEMEKTFGYYLEGYPEMESYLLGVCTTYGEYAEAYEEYSSIYWNDRSYFFDVIRHYMAMGEIQTDWLEKYGRYAEFYLESIADDDTFYILEAGYDALLALRYVLNPEVDREIFGKYRKHMEDNGETMVKPSTQKNIRESFERYQIYKRAKAQFDDDQTLTEEWKKLCGRFAKRAINVPWKDLYDLFIYGSFPLYFKNMDEKLSQEPDFF